MTVIIRDALTEEFNDVASLNIEAYREYSHSLSSDSWTIMQTNLSKVAEIAKTGRLIIAQRNQALVGSVIYCPPGTSDSRIFKTEWASLRMLAVLPHYQGQGIGYQLSLECINRAKQDKAKVMALHTSELMIAARRMYKKLGFKQDIELSNPFGIKYWRYMLELAE